MFCQAISLEIQQQEDELRNVVSLAYKLQENPLISVSQKEKILEDSNSLKQNWEELETVIEEKAKR